MVGLFIAIHLCQDIKMKAKLHGISTTSRLNDYSRCFIISKNNNLFLNYRLNGSTITVSPASTPLFSAGRIM